ncbi:WhiB family transcriptional regulator [Streptomyces eurythermus]
MTATTRLLTRPASPATRRIAKPWRTSAACRPLDLDLVFSDRSSDQAQVQGTCRACPVRARCLTDAVDYEKPQHRLYGVAGGLTPVQRGALRVHTLLGEYPDLGQARMLSAPRFAAVLHGWRGWPPNVIAEQLRRNGVIATAVTVRVALWWTGAKGSLLGSASAGDERLMWERVRDDHRQVVEDLLGLGLARRNVALFLGTSDEQVKSAVAAWRRQDKKTAARAAEVWAA